MKSQITLIACDGCQGEIKDSLKAGRIGELDLCEKCLKEAYLEHERVVHGRVPTRRGGFRQLGEYDG